MTGLPLLCSREGNVLLFLRIGTRACCSQPACLRLRERRAAVLLSHNLHSLSCFCCRYHSNQSPHEQDQRQPLPGLPVRTSGVWCLSYKGKKTLPGWPWP